MQNLHPTFEKSCREKGLPMVYFLANTAHCMIFQTKSFKSAYTQPHNQEWDVFLWFLSATFCAGEIPFGAFFFNARS